MTIMVLIVLEVLSMNREGLQKKMKAMGRLKRILGLERRMGLALSRRKIGIALLSELVKISNLVIKKKKQIKQKKTKYLKSSCNC